MYETKCMKSDIEGQVRGLFDNFVYKEPKI